MQRMSVEFRQNKTKFDSAYDERQNKSDYEQLWNPFEMFKMC